MNQWLAGALFANILSYSLFPIRVLLLTTAVVFRSRLVCDAVDLAAQHPTTTLSK